jgi:hypothetical protein
MSVELAVIHHCESPVNTATYASTTGSQNPGVMRSFKRSCQKMQKGCVGDRWVVGTVPDSISAAVDSNSSPVEVEVRDAIKCRDGD